MAKKTTEQTFDPNKHLISLKGKDYLEVKYRLVWFRQENPVGRIETQLVERGEGWALFKAIVTGANGAVATAYAQETKKDFAEYLEKAETKAVGRALGMLGYGTQFAPDLDFEEAGKDKIVDAPANSSKAPKRPEATPDGVDPDTGEKADPNGITSYFNPYQKKMYYLSDCSHCGRDGVWAKSASFTDYKFGRILCPDCQKLAENGELEDPKNDVTPESVTEAYGDNRQLPF